ncbi:hypothetical protein L4C34_17730 [Vibrio profundum]|uniref:hypothetical protein n=1 Tax=Vibrio profundum TaxID=2910247 RepID=UPI003D0C83A4
MKSVVLEEKPYSTRESKTWKQLNEFHFSGLWEVMANLTGSEFFDSDVKATISPDGETWAFVIPEKLVSLLAIRTGKDNTEII